MTFILPLKHIGKPNRYVVVGGDVYKGYPGVTSFLGFSIIYIGNNKSKAIRVCNDNNEKCDNLTIAIDTFTGKRI